MQKAASASKLEIIRPGFDSRFEKIVCGFSIRTGGVSIAPYDSLNVSVSCGDDPGAVEENRRRLFAVDGIDVADVALGGLVHGSVVRHVLRPGLVHNCDGLVTAQPGIALAATAADCAIVLLADPRAGVVGACHAGWRGVVSGIISNTVDAMTDLGAKVDNIAAYVSPCISVDEFEVGPEVASQFPAECVVRRGNKLYVDLKRSVEEQVRDKGVTQLEVDPQCTYQDEARFFSYRRDRSTGRMLGYIMIRDGK